MDELCGYELVELLGTGGMGRVYRAIHHPSGQEVAIKRLLPEVRDDAMHRRLFLDEATAAAKLDDPRIIRLLDVGRDDDDVPFLVMELGRGPSILELIDHWAGWAPIAAATVATLEGLAAAHAAGVVHRDLKPANVLLEPETGSARILDFGVAALIDPLRGRESKDVVGTPEYMPPEQLLGTGPFGPWTDLYAIGVMLAQVIRGRSPFAHHEGLAPLLLAKASYRRPPELTPAREGLVVPAALDELVERLLQPHPRDRPRFAIEVARELAALAPQVIDEVPLTAVGIFESIDSTQRTTFDGREESGAIVPPIPLPAWLPAPPSLTVGASLSRLRELPMVGREAERDRLMACVDDVARGGGARLVAYVGEAGIGKSRLARWGLAHVEREGRMQGAAGGYDDSGADVAGGLRHALRRLVGLPLKGWDGSFQWYAGAPGLDVERLVAYLRAEDDSEGFGIDAVVSLAHATLRAVGQTYPIFLWLDDLAWARDGAIELTQRLLEAGDVPILIVATLRAGAMHAARDRMAPLLAHPRAELHRVDPLGEDERAHLLREIAPLAPDVARALAERIEGSPLLLDHLVRDWMERGHLALDGEELRPRDGASVDELLVLRPLSMIFADRLDGLFERFGARRDRAEAVLGRAALLGLRFEHAALEAACARDAELAATLDDVLDRALLLGLVRSEQAHLYAFDHGLLHEAVVARIERSAGRRDALVDAANGLLARYGKERPDVSALVADRLWRAGDRAGAWERQLRAAHRAAWAADDFIAVGYLSVARTWAAEDPSMLAELELTEARVHYYAQRYEPALAHVEAGARHARAAGDEAMELSCRMLSSSIYFYQDRLAESERIARAIYEVPDREDPRLLDVRALAAHRLLDLASLRDDLDEALEHARACVALEERAGRFWRIAVAWLNQAELHVARGEHEPAQTITLRMAERARAAQDQSMLVAVKECRAKHDVVLGRPARGRPFLEARCAEVRENGDTWRVTGLLACIALASVEMDDDADAEANVRAFVDAFRAVPHEEPLTRYVIRRLAERLEDAGKAELTREIDALLEARAAIHRAGFAAA